MLFLVKGLVTYHPYMENSRKPQQEMRLVEAADDSEAEEKFHQYFRSMGSPNDDSYTTSEVEAFAPIL